MLYFVGTLLLNATRYYKMSFVISVAALKQGNRKQWYEIKMALAALYSVTSLWLWEQMQSDMGIVKPMIMAF